MEGNGTIEERRNSLPPSIYAVKLSLSLSSILFYKIMQVQTVLSDDLHNQNLTEIYCAANVLKKGPSGGRQDQTRALHCQRANA